MQANNTNMQATTTTTESPKEIPSTETIATTPKNTPAQKRLRELQNSFLGNVNKTPRLTQVESPLKFITIMDKRFDKLTEQILDMMQSKFKEYKDELLSEIDKRLIVIRNDIHAVNERVSYLESVTINEIKKSVKKLEAENLEVKNMKKEILDLKRKQLKHENSVVAGGIRIRGIPYYENEDLFQIFSTICDSLNLSTPQVENIYRLKKIYKENKPYSPNDEVLVIKLYSPYEKNYFLKTIAKYRRENKTSLCLKHAGFNSTEPIYVNENLTPHNHKILQSALKMKTERKIKTAFSLRGLVYVKKLNSDDPILIEFLHDLDQLFHA